MEKVIAPRVTGRINMIVAAGLDGEIGRSGNLIWRIPADLRRFKSLTMGHPIIMGRKTWESLPKRPLPGRRNIVVTRSVDYEATGGFVARSPEDAVAIALSEDGDGAPRECGDFFVIGGAELYATFLPITDRIYLTEIDATCAEADAHLPYPLDTDIWHRVEESDWETADGVRYRYVTLDRDSRS